MIRPLRVSRSEKIHRYYMSDMTLKPFSKGVIALLTGRGADGIHYSVAVSGIAKSTV